MLQAVESRPGEWPRICPEDVRELMPDLGRVARRLYIHPQTARYRLRRLQSLFGDALHEPDARFELEIALRAERLLGPADGTLSRHDDARG